MVYVLLGTGFEEVEAIAPIDIMRRAGIDVLSVGVTGKTVFGGHGIGVEADIVIDEFYITFDHEMTKKHFMIIVTNFFFSKKL